MATTSNAKTIKKRDEPIHFETIVFPEKHQSIRRHYVDQNRLK